MPSSNSGFSTDLATGTQDLVALAGLFCTDSVEINAYATQNGYFLIAISAASLLGILGLVRGAIKLALGLKLCREAGFNLDSLRGILGYLPGETAAVGEAVECDLVSVSMTSTNLVIRKRRKIFNNELNPILSVGSPWNDLYPRSFDVFPIIINLGNASEERLLNHYVTPFIAALVCSGATSWLVVVVNSPWNAIRIFATAGLHLSLMVLLAVPLFHKW
jgi:hypothetical protein